MDSYTIKAYAKINLGLDVLGCLPNGYHQVKMVMQSVGIYDELLLQRADHGIVLTTDSGELPTDENNLIYKAARLMQERYGLREGVRIHLQKSIPIAAGMAGGSTDAAAAMKGMRELFCPDVTDGELMDAAVKIGADVPYCVMGGTALAEGIGERLTALKAVPEMTLLVAKPGIGVSTKEVYPKLDATRLRRHPDIDGMVAAIKEGNLRGVVERMENVLENVTIPAHPVIATIKQRMLELGAHNSLMSGSGPTVFGVFPDRACAEHACEQLRREELAKQLFVTSTV